MVILGNAAAKLNAVAVFPANAPAPTARPIPRTDRSAAIAADDPAEDMAMALLMPVSAWPTRVLRPSTWLDSESSRPLIPWA